MEEDKVELPYDKLKNIKSDFECDGEFMKELHVDPVECINVILMGKTQTGKTSIVKTLINPAFTHPQQFASLTEKASVCSLILNDASSSKSFQLNIIDTPGLSERKIDKSQRSDQKILDVTTECIFRGITSINLVCLVYRAGNMTPEDVKIFNTLIDYFPEEFKNIIALVITHSDSLSNKERVDHEKQVKEDANLEKLNTAITKGVHFTGMIPNIAEDEPEFRPIYLRKVSADREKLLKLFLSCAGPGMQTKEIADIQRKMRSYLTEIRESLEKEVQVQSKSRGPCVVS